jgi:SAM-dependent methyltransferase
MIIQKKCRNCQSLTLINLFSLGELSYSGKFPKSSKLNIKKTEITLVICDECKLVQLKNKFNMKYLYNHDYGYRTGINKTMTSHMKKIKEILSQKSKLKSCDYILDIASNDGTLLNFYDRDIIKVGIDPLINKYKKLYKNIQFKISNFFSLNLIKKNKLKKKFKIITALSVFYDIDDPNKFLEDIFNILDDNGIFLLEYTDLYSIIKRKMFDTICQEHITYYSTKVILEILIKNNLRIFDIKRNNINGGSIQYFICKKNANFKSNSRLLSRTLREESKLELDNLYTYQNFYKNILDIRNKIINCLDDLIKNKKTIHGYGASTKGNVLLQFCGINKKYIKYIAERNPNKYNLYTPGTKIKIISEHNSRLLKPDYYFVLPWHFKKEILSREKVMIKRGTKFIFPLPNFQIC